MSFSSVGQTIKEYVNVPVQLVKEKFAELSDQQKLVLKTVGVAITIFCVYIIVKKIYQRWFTKPISPNNTSTTSKTNDTAKDALKTDESKKNATSSIRSSLSSDEITKQEQKETIYRPKTWRKPPTEQELNELSVDIVTPAPASETLETKQNASPSLLGEDNPGIKRRKGSSGLNLSKTIKSTFSSKSSLGLLPDPYVMDEKTNQFLSYGKPLHGRCKINLVTDKKLEIDGDFENGILKSGTVLDKVNQIKWEGTFNHLLLEGQGKTTNLKTGQVDSGQYLAGLLHGEGTTSIIEDRTHPSGKIVKIRIVEKGEYDQGRLKSGSVFFYKNKTNTLYQHSRGQYNNQGELTGPDCEIEFMHTEVKQEKFKFLKDDYMIPARLRYTGHFEHNKLQGKGEIVINELVLVQCDTFEKGIPVGPGYVITRTPDSSLKVIEKKDAVTFDETGAIKS